MGLFHRKINAGETIAFAGRQITPQSVSLELHVPGKHGGLIVNRPHSVSVTEADGSERTLSIPKPTSKIQYIMPGILLLILIIKLTIARTGGRHE